MSQVMAGRGVGTTSRPAIAVGFGPSRSYARRSRPIDPKTKGAHSYEHQIKQDNGMGLCHECGRTARGVLIVAVQLGNDGNLGHG